MDTDDGPAVLRRALDQLAALLDDVPDTALGKRTPCEPWTVHDLVDHVAAAPARFARMARGESIDWSSTPSAGPDPAAQFRANAEDLLAAVRDPELGERVPVDWQCRRARRAHLGPRDGPGSVDRRPGRGGGRP